MQFAKDSFYLALRSRLAALNPQRIAVIDGTSQPAILVADNEAVTSGQKLADCFYVGFGAAQVLQKLSTPRLMSLEVTISYRTRGTADGGADRGRTLTALDTELLAICEPVSAPKCDYTKQAAVDLGTKIFWTTPLLGAVQESGTEVRRTATMSVYFYPEASV